MLVSGARVGSGRGALAAEEAGPEAAALEDLEFGFEAGAFFDEAGLLFDEFYLLAGEAFAFAFELRLILFEGGDGFFLQFLLELQKVQAFYLRPEAVYLHARGVALLADLFDLARALLQAGLVVLALL